MATVEIPDEMYSEISAIVNENPEYGYENVEEFVREAIRRNFDRP
ncbi:MAG: hypothetical protein PHP63_07515 [Candidatus Marinimicrobia bacterium]|jgi:Arc/MetJ-type ribon-helix-helix transcriptional regulator|nr:hypothetical protein [Candidatus Neomarinimicrobiota bacterium]